MKNGLSFFINTEMTDSNKNIILTKYLNKEHSLNDYLKLKYWFRNDNDFKDLKQPLKQEWEKETKQEFDHLDNRVFEQITNNIWLEDEKRKANENSWHILYKVAAVLLIGLLAGYFVSNLKRTTIDPVCFTAHAPKGSISETILPDGSLIVLNSGSLLKYSLDKNNQVTEVSLSGEAWFNIHHNPKRIFKVKTPQYHVNVLGTQFNVKAYEEDNEVVTTLVKGKVSISSGDNFSFDYSPELQPNEQFLLNKETQKGLIRVVNTKQYTAWKDNKLIFINMDLKELFVLLERKFGVEIKVGSSEILDLHYTGTIKNETVLEVLNLITLTLPIKYEIVEQEIKITKTK